MKRIPLTKPSPKKRADEYATQPGRKEQKTIKCQKCGGIAVEMSAMKEKAYECMKCRSVWKVTSF